VTPHRTPHTTIPLLVGILTVYSSVFFTNQRLQKPKNDTTYILTQVDQDILSVANCVKWQLPVKMSPDEFRLYTFRHDSWVALLYGSQESLIDDRDLSVNPNSNSIQILKTYYTYINICNSALIITDWPADCAYKVMTK